MTTLDLDALERAAEEWKRVIRNDATPSQVGPTEADIDLILEAFRALQERVEGAEKALRPFADFIEQFDAGMIEGVRSMEPDGGAVPDDEVLQLISPDDQCRMTTGEMAFGRKTPILPPKQITNGHLRAARVYFAARTKAGEPHEQG